MEPVEFEKLMLDMDLDGFVAIQGKCLHMEGWFSEEELRDILNAFEKVTF